MRDGGVVADQLAEIDEVAAELAANDDLAGFGQRLSETTAAARRATQWLLANGATDPNQALGASSPYLRLLGTVVCGGLIGRLALAAADGQGSVSDEFRAAKIVSARFFGEQILPTVLGLEATVTAGSADLFTLTADQLA